MENKFFVKPDKTTAFICGDKPTCIDYVYYHELLSAMILSGNGSQSEFFSADTATRLYKLPNLTKWYRTMANDKACKKISDQFIVELKS